MGWTGFARVCLLALASAAASASDESPRWKSGDLPRIPQQTLAWGEVLLEVVVVDGGDVESTIVLRSTPPFTDALQEAVAGWCFEPVLPDGFVTFRRALVAAAFRPPALVDAPSLGGPPQDLASASEAVPFPVRIVNPLYPPRALGDGVVLLEASVGEDGTVRAAAILRSAPGFDESAQTAALAWKFRPAERDGIPISARALLLFAYRQPIIAR